MPVATQNVIAALAQLTEQEGIRVAMTESGKGALKVCAATFLGGLLFGPVGLAIGGTVGGVCAATQAKQFKPVAVVIRDMSPQQQERLVESVKRAFQNVNMFDVVAILPLLANNEALRQIAIGAVTDFMRNEMSMMIAN